MRPSPERRLVILTEGQFQVHNAKTALGVIRYGPDPVVALLDSTIAGRRASDIVGPDPRFDMPAVATLDEALASSGRRPCSSASRRPAASCLSIGDRRSAPRSTPGSTS